MGNHDEYRRAALDCLQLADASTDPQSRLALLKMGQMWVRLAEQAARNSRTEFPYDFLNDRYRNASARHSR